MSGNKYLIVMLLCIFLVGFVSAGCPLQTIENNGYCEIYNWTGLNNTRSNISSMYILMDDLTITDTDYGGIGDSWQMITGTFSGTLNGNNKNIYGLVVPNKKTVIEEFSGTIINLSLNIDGRSLIKDMVGGEINACFISGKLNGTDPETILGLSDMAAGFVLQKFDGIINNCSFTGNITGGEFTAGIVSYSYGGTINNSYFSGIINGGEATGGIVGAGLSSIERCYSVGIINGEKHTGGIAGEIDGALIINSYSLANITGNASSSGEGSGGLVGSVYSSEAISQIINSYFAGTISGFPSADPEYIGGLVGYKQKGTAVSSYWDKEVSGVLISALGTNKTTQEMKTESTFVNWDFENIWIIDTGANNGYPFLFREPTIIPSNNTCSLINYIMFNFLAVAIAAALLFWILTTKDDTKKIISRVVYSMIIIAIIFGLISIMC